jgi:U4/U6 small nuclear ribonucleoprotein SNU13
MAVSAKAVPMASPDLTAAILELVANAVQQRQLRKGANEVTKSLNRSKAEVVIIAGDVDPIEIVMHLPLLCEDKDVEYIFVPCRAALRRACQVPRSAVACSIMQKQGSILEKTINNLKVKIQETMAAGIPA